MSFFKPKPATSTQSSLSENVNNQQITGAYAPAMQTGVNAMQTIGNALGLAGGGFQEYANQAGFAPALQQLQQNITGQGAAAGLLNSGATSRALMREGANLNQQYYNNWLQNLQGLAGLGNQAGGLVSNAGQRSTSTGSSSGAQQSGAATVGNILGGAAMLFSDPRLKTDIRKIGEYADGLGIYSYRMLTGVKQIIGVMADEVARLRPHALGPKIHGYQTVNYGAL